MICPRDNIPLQPQSLGEVHLHYCSKCFGMWFLKDELKEMLYESKEHKYLPDLVEPAVTHDPDLDHTPCPVDHHSIMSHVDFEGVKLDICRRHRGIWLDYGEFMILYALYLNETDGESFLKEDTSRFIWSLFMRREPLRINRSKKSGVAGFLATLHASLAPLDIVRWIFTGKTVSGFIENTEEKEPDQE
ncbi:MAG: zf-TFIIB domain-containing protein [Pseudomonadota bacterium]